MSGILPGQLHRIPKAPGAGGDLQPNGGGLPRGYSGILFQANSSGETQNTHPITPTLAPGSPHCHPLEKGRPLSVNKGIRTTAIANLGVASLPLCHPLVPSLWRLREIRLLLSICFSICKSALGKKYSAGVPFAAHPPRPRERSLRAWYGRSFGHRAWVCTPALPTCVW